MDVIRGDPSLLDDRDAIDRPVGSAVEPEVIDLREPARPTRLAIGTHDLGDGRGRIRALDGLRGLAVGAVVVYHLSPDLLPGGFLGVSVFFVLSGYLITTLLLGEATSTGSIGLSRFWGRRFRRLMPAALAGLALGVAVAALVGDAHQLRTLPGDVTAAAAYVANWRFIALGTSYGAHYQQPSVVQHFWSLAIEEQFYLVVALVAAALARFAPSRRSWFLAFGALAVASMATTLALGPQDTTRIYFGTATRAFELLTGSLLAVVLARWTPPTSRVSRRLLQLLGLAALTALLAAFRFVPIDSAILYRGGLWIAAGVTAAAVLALRTPGRLAGTMSWRPLVALGLISYGVYLYHWPLFIWLTPATTHLDGFALAALRIVVTLALALASYHLLEQPIRRQRWSLPRPAMAGVIGISLLAIVGGAVAVGRQATSRAIVAAPEVELAVPTTLAGSPPPTPADVAPLPPPARVLLIGDSMLHDAFPAIRADFAAAGPVATAIGGPGQTLMTDGGRWLADISQAVASGDPDVVILESCCGAQEAWTTPAGQRIEPDTPAFWVEWRRLAEEATTRAGARGARVMWVVPPPADGVKSLWYGDIKSRMEEMSRIDRGIATTRPDVLLIDWAVLAAADGSYTRTLPDVDGKPVVVRADDGVHFSPAGQALQARTTVEQVLAAWQRSGGRPTPG